MGVVRTWVGNRLREVSTYVGGGMVAFGSLGMTSTNPTAQQVLEVANQVLPMAGAALVAMSTKHP